jgi:hypothetical protein
MTAKRFASLGATIVAVMLFMGASIPTSYADNLVFDCINSGNTTNTVICTGNGLGNNVGNVTIGDIEQLSNNQLSFLENALHNVAFNFLSINLQEVETNVLNIFNNSVVLPDIGPDQVLVCILGICSN